MTPEEMREYLEAWRQHERVIDLEWLDEYGKRMKRQIRIALLVWLVAASLVLALVVVLK